MYPTLMSFMSVIITQTTWFCLQSLFIIGHSISRAFLCNSNIQNLPFLPDTTLLWGNISLNANLTEWEELVLELMAPVPTVA